MQLDKGSGGQSNALQKQPGNRVTENRKPRIEESSHSRFSVLGYAVTRLLRFFCRFSVTRVPGCLLLLAIQAPTNFTWVHLDPGAAFGHLDVCGPEDRV